MVETGFYHDVTCWFVVGYAVANLTLLGLALGIWIYWVGLDA